MAEVAHFQDAALRAGCGFAPFYIHVPAGFGGGDFLWRGLAFWEEADAAGGEMGVGEGEELVERGQSAGGDEGGWWRFGGFYALGENFGGDAELGCGFGEEGGFAFVGFYQGEGNAGGYGEDEAGEAGAGA